MNNLKTFLQTCLNLPGAVVINFNKAIQGIEDDVDFYEIGVQQAVEKTPKRFVNICSRDNEVVMIYFKHDHETIQDLYEQNACFMPSEIASAHWSKIVFPNTLTSDEVKKHIVKSHQLICNTLSKKRQNELEQIATENNPYLTFKEKAEQLMKTNSSVEFHYNHIAFWAPTITVDDKPMAYFYNNSVYFKTDNFTQPHAVDADWENSLLFCK